MYLNKDGSGVNHVVHEGVKVFLTEDVIVGPDISHVPVHFGVNFTVPFQKNSKIFYDGSCKNKKVEGIQGIIDPNQENIKVLIKGKNDENLKQVSLKRGSRIGTVNTVVELEDDGGDETKWSLQDIKEKVNCFDLYNLNWEYFE